METASASQRYPIDASADALQSVISGQISLQDDGAQPARVSVAQRSSVSFLGTSSAQPVPGKRNMSSLVIATEAGSGIMVDCGEGTQHQLMRSMDVKVTKISAIFITHLHGDHCYGLFGLLSTLALNGRSLPLPVLGPVGVKEMVMTVLRLSGGEELSYPLFIHELDATRHHDLTIDLSIAPHAAERLFVHASPLSHRVPTLGYVVGELARPGGLDSAKAMALGAKGSALGRLKRGDDVVLDDGRTIRALDVLKAPPVRRAVCVLQDTMQSDEAEQYLTSASFPCQLALLIHECTYDDSLAEQVGPCILSRCQSFDLCGAQGMQCLRIEGLAIPARSIPRDSKQAFRIIEHEPEAPTLHPTPTPYPTLSVSLYCTLSPTSQALTSNPQPLGVSAGPLDIGDGRLLRRARAGPDARDHALFFSLLPS